MKEEEWRSLPCSMCSFLCFFSSRFGGIGRAGEGREVGFCCVKVAAVERRVSVQDFFDSKTRRESSPSAWGLLLGIFDFVGHGVDWTAA